MMSPQDREHLALTNRIIGQLNRFMKEEGYEPDFVASAVVAAAAAFSVFNLSDCYTKPIGSEDIKRLAQRFSGRCDAALKERGGNG